MSLLDQIEIMASAGHSKTPVCNSVLRALIENQKDTDHGGSRTDTPSQAPQGQKAKSMHRGGRRNGGSDCATG
jgi:hypothetical protein